MSHGDLPATLPPEDADDPDIFLVAANMETWTLANPCHAQLGEDEEACRARRGEPCPCWEEDDAEA